MASLDVVTSEGRPITRLSNLLSKSPQYRSSASPETKLVSRQADFDFQRAITIDVKNESKVILPEKRSYNVVVFSIKKKQVHQNILT